MKSDLHGISQKAPACLNKMDQTVMAWGVIPRAALEVVVGESVA